MVISSDEKFKALKNALARVSATVEEFARSEGTGIEYEALEERIAEEIAGIERAAHQFILQSWDLDAPRVLIGGEPFVRAGHSDATYHTLAGDVIVRRTLYRKAGERNSKVVDTVSLRAGVVGDGWLPKAAKEMAYLVQQGTSREAEATARCLVRLPYSRSSFERVTHEVGELYMRNQARIDRAQTVALDLPETATGISVSLDRVSVPMEEPRKRPRGRPKKGAPKRPVQRNFRMAYCGTLTLNDKDGKALYTIRYAGMPQCDPSSICQQLKDDAQILLLKRPELKVVLLCDGAPELWNLLRSVFTKEALGKDIHELVDLWHLLEKLAVVSQILFGPTEASAKLLRWRLRLLNEPMAAAAIFEELLASGKQHVVVGNQCPVDDVMRYMANLFDRMDYATARRLGLPVGSGNVEATCKTLFEVRMKRCGSRWKEPTGEHIVRLRALASSDRWDHALPLVLAPLRITVQKAA